MGRAILLLLLLLAPVVLASERDGLGYHWHRDEATDGIVVYTSGAADHAYDAYRLVMTVRAPLAQLLDTLQRFEDYPRWFHGCLDARVLSRPAQPVRVWQRADGRVTGAAADGAFTVFFLQDTPHVSNRWAVLHGTLRIAPSRAVVLEFTSLDKLRYAAPAGTVRMRIRGSWTLTPLAAAETRVQLVLDVDPRVSAPAFIVDPYLREIAVETARALRHGHDLK